MCIAPGRHIAVAETFYSEDANVQCGPLFKGIECVATVLYEAPMLRNGEFRKAGAVAHRLLRVLSKLVRN